MLKKFLITLAAIFFATGVLISSVIRTTAQTSFSRNEIGQVAGETSVQATPASSSKVDYFLAYPGILPDHFLYPLKMIRDRIWLFLTWDALKKAEVLLLFADKRLGAGKALVEGGQEQLGITTLTKAEKYLERAILQAEAAKEKKKNTGFFYEKLEKATLKHEEIITSLLEKVSDQSKSTLEEILSYPKKGHQRVLEKK